MPPIKPIEPQSLAATKLGNHQANFETHRQVIDHVNKSFKALQSAGDLVTPASFTLKGLATSSISSVNGTILRGNVTINVTGSPSLNPSITLSFPKGSFDQIPGAIVTKNGGTGTLGVTWTEQVSSLTMQLNGTPSAGTSYTLAWLVRS